MLRLVFISLIATFLSIDAMAWTPIVSEMSSRESISKAEVKSIFTFVTRQWLEPNGRRSIVVVIYDTNTSKFNEFSRDILGMNPDVYREYIESRVANGDIPDPIRVIFDAQMRVTVSRNMYAIGYLNEGLYMHTPFGVKYLKIVE